MRFFLIRDDGPTYLRSSSDPTAVGRWKPFRPGTLRRHLSVVLPLSVLRLWRNAGTR